MSYADAVALQETRIVPAEANFLSSDFVNLDSLFSIPASSYLSRGGVGAYLPSPLGALQVDSICGGRGGSRQSDIRHHDIVQWRAVAHVQEQHWLQ